MKSRLFASLLLAAIVPFLINSEAISALWQFHTTPDKWKEPRSYHTPMEKEYKNRLSLSHQPMPDTMNAEKRFSPNNAYWFAYQDAQSDKPILIFNEREYLIAVIVNPNGPIRSISAKWINEKLLYIEIWWGRVLGSGYIYDVEKEAIIYQEMVHDGVIPFQQWEPARKKAK